MTIQLEKSTFILIHERHATVEDAVFGHILTIQYNHASMSFNEWLKTSEMLEELVDHAIPGDELNVLEQAIAAFPNVLRIN